MTSAELLDRFAGIKVLVVGDLMLDEYLFGHATRISQEAPVMVVRQDRRESVPGGAANVARNIVALGGSADIVGVVGDDDSGRELVSGLRKMGLGTDDVFSVSDRPTTRKTRVLADSNHQVLRVDHESASAVQQSDRENLVDRVTSRLSGNSVLLLSDYQKGVLSKESVAALIAAAQNAGVPVVANAKPRSIAWYRGATLVSLNRPEAVQALGLDSLAPDKGIEAAQATIREFGLLGALVTLGKDGMAAADSQGRKLFIPPVPVEVGDVAGAGDTTIATVALGLAAIGFQQEVFDLAARTSSAVVQHVGVAVPTQEDVRLIRSDR